jgi:hypothetical protein
VSVDLSIQIYTIWCLLMIVVLTSFICSQFSMDVCLVQFCHFLYTILCSPVKNLD